MITYAKYLLIYSSKIENKKKPTNCLYNDRHANGIHKEFHAVFMRTTIDARENERHTQREKIPSENNLQTLISEQWK